MGVVNVTPDSFFDGGRCFAPDQAIRVILERIRLRRLPFHWFRNVLKSPDWYVAVQEKLKAANPKIELLDAPTFFELYRIYLKNTPDASKGNIPLLK